MKTASNSLSRLLSPCKHASAFDDPQLSADMVQRMIRLEGGTKKITRDTGGVTKGGIAETNGRYTAAQIRALTPQQISQHWGEELNTIAPIQNPGTREMLFHLRANMGAPRADRMLQEETNRLLPKGQRITTDRRLGPGTFAAANAVPQARLSEALQKRWQGQHQMLAAKSEEHRAYASGWKARREAVSASPHMNWLHPVKVKPSPAATQRYHSQFVQGPPAPTAPPKPQAPPTFASR